MGLRDWRDAAAELGRILKLDFIGLASLTSEAATAARGDPYEGALGTDSTACWVLSLIPEGRINLVSWEMTVMAWHVDHPVYDARAAMLHKAYDEEEDEEV